LCSPLVANLVETYPAHLRQDYDGAARHTPLIIPNQEDSGTSPVMAQLNAFNAALIRCGFNNDTADAITAEGFDTLDTLADVEESDIDSMIKNIRKTHRALGAQAQGNVTFPFLAIRRFKAMHSWAGELKRTDRALNAGLYAGALITTAVLHYSLECMHTAMTEDEDIIKPKELSDLTHWEKFREQWKLYAGRL